MIYSRRLLTEINFDQGKFKEALRDFENGLRLLEPLANANPELIDLQSELGSTYFNLGLIYEALGRDDQSFDNFLAAVVVFRKLSEANPKNDEFPHRLANSLSQVGHSHYLAKRFSDAVLALEQALEILERLTVNFPMLEEIHSDYANSLHEFADIQLSLSGPATALPYYEKAVDRMRKLVEMNPRNPNRLASLGALLNDAATLEIEARDFPAAESKIREAIEFQKRALKIGPNNFQIRQFLGNHLYNLGRIATGLNDTAIHQEVRVLKTELAIGDPKFVTLDQRLMEVIAGAPVKNSSELLALAERALATGRYGWSTIWYEQAFAENEGELLKDREAQFAYQAAKAAVLAATGEGPFENVPNKEAQAKLRQRHQTAALSVQLTWKRRLQ